MNQATIKTLGVTALSAAFIGAGAGAASAAAPASAAPAELPGPAAALSGPVQGVHDLVNTMVGATTPLQKAFLTEGAIGKVPTEPGDVLAPSTLPADAATGSREGGLTKNMSSENVAGDLLGGLPLVGELAKNLPVQGLPLG